MPLKHFDQSANSPASWRIALWIIVIVGASLGFSRAFACATPFAALAALAGTQMRWREAALAVALAWVVNQAIGFLVLGYPHTPMTFAWGAAIGLAALSALAIAFYVSRLRVPLVVSLGIALITAFAAYEGVLYTTALVLDAGTAAFTPPIVGRLLAINAVALVGLYLLNWAASPTRASQSNSFSFQVRH